MSDDEIILPTIYKHEVKNILQKLLCAFIVLCLHQSILRHFFKCIIVYTYICKCINDYIFI